MYIEQHKVQKPNQVDDWLLGLAEFNLYTQYWPDNNNQSPA